MDNYRAMAAILLGKVIAFVSQLVGFGGTSLPGKVALFLYPDLIKRLIVGYSSVAVITGTNGKTTTANLIGHLLRLSGREVTSNGEGANMAPGIATALLKDVARKGRERVAVLEVDEGSMGQVLRFVEPTVVIITNFFRDQLDRYWELSRLLKSIRSALALYPRTALLLNADDPLAASLGEGRQFVFYYGLEGVSGGTAQETRETAFCPRCWNLLQYSKSYYSQLGEYHCPCCAYSHPLNDWSVTPLEKDGSLSLRLQAPDFNLNLEAPLSGLYNAYNVLAAASCCLYLGLSGQAVQEGLLSFNNYRGRAETFLVNGKRCTLYLIKNPTGANESLKALLGAKGSKAVLLAINDNAADGRDVSWLWDADFEVLAAGDFTRFVCSGQRGADMALRLKYAGIDPQRIALNRKKEDALARLLAGEESETFVLCTYTNLRGYRKLLSTLGGPTGEDQNLPPLSRTPQPLR